MTVTATKRDPYAGFEVARTITVNATAEALYTMVSDVARMGEWSPECGGGEWLPGGSPGRVGSRFLGHNRRDGRVWSTECEVLAADPPRVFSFAVVRIVTTGVDLDPGDLVWTFQVESEGRGCRLTQRMRLAKVPTALRASLEAMSEEERHSVVADRRPRVTRGMETTLERIRVAAERA